MRASKTNLVRKSAAGHVGRRPGSELHISGAECICEKAEMPEIGRSLIERALTHPRGNPDTIVITADEIKEKLLTAPLLALKTLDCSSPEKAWEIISEHMLMLGISGKSLSAAYKIFRSDNSLRGAALISAQSGKRLEPDKKRGIRVSRLGLAPSSQNRLTEKLSGLGINTITVKEALLLASKVASCKYVTAEICVSDDPDYTTGYIASKKLGYIRIPNIKKGGDMHGGRVFFVKEKANIKTITGYLQGKPVLLECH
jgi:6-carboxyhexanoate--CoA ligase